MVWKPHTTEEEREREREREGVGCGRCLLCRGELTPLSTREWIASLLLAGVCDAEGRARRDILGNGCRHHSVRRGDALDQSARRFADCARLWCFGNRTYERRSRAPSCLADSDRWVLGVANLQCRDSATFDSNTARRESGFSSRRFSDCSDAKRRQRAGRF